MERSVRWLLALLIVGALSRSFAARGDVDSSKAWHRPELEYFKAVNRVGPPRDPQLLFLLMGQYANANMHRDGIEFFSSLMKEFAPRSASIRVSPSPKCLRTPWHETARDESSGLVMSGTPRLAQAQARAECSGGSRS